MLHTLWLALTRLLTGKTLDVTALFGLISSDAPAQRWAMDFVVRRRLDRRSVRTSWLFRFNDAPWYYLLTGADFDPGEEPDLIAVSAIVNACGKPMLYTGMLDEFFLDQEGKLNG